MEKIKKGDIVGRKSYNKDILFIVERIIKSSRNKTIVLLNGLNLRIQADSDIEDLELIDPKTIEEHEKIVQSKLKKRLEKQDTLSQRSNKIIYTGRILHLDGDRRYSEKSNLFYKKMGLNAVVKNIPEYRQAPLVSELIKKYKPDILVITGHDRND